jgi:hypothetical protein
MAITEQQQITVLQQQVGILKSTITSLAAQVSTFQADLQMATLTMESAYSDLNIYVSNLTNSINQYFGTQQLASNGIAPTPFQFTPTGAVDGTNTLFTLPVNPKIIFVTQNGSLLSQGVGYATAIQNNVYTITFTNPPQVGDNINATGLY